MYTYMYRERGSYVGQLMLSLSEVILKVFNLV